MISYFSNDNKLLFIKLAKILHQNSHLPLFAYVRRAWETQAPSAAGTRTKAE